MFENKTQYPIRKRPSRRMFEISFVKNMNLGQIRSRVENKSEKWCTNRMFPEFGQSDRAEFLAGGRYRNSAADKRLDLPKVVRAGCWTPHSKLVRILVQIQQGSTISEIAGQSSIGTRQKKFRVVVDLIPHNSTKAII